MNPIRAEIRSPQTKAKTLRKTGSVPCCIFGPSLSETLSIQISQADAKKLLKTSGEGCRTEIELGEVKKAVLIKEISRNTVKDEIEHIAFLMLEEGRKVNTSAKIVLLNKDKIPGYVSQSLFRIPYAALPADLVETVTVDLAALQIGRRLTVKDLPIAQNKKVELLLSTESPVLSVVEKRAQVRKAE